MPVEAKRRLILFSMASHSGMGRVASELAMAAVARFGDGVTLVAPPLEREPAGVQRIRFTGPKTPPHRISKLLNLLLMNAASIGAAWRASRRGSIFVMVDLFSTVPLSILPALVARFRGCRIVLNLHDLYPHAPRFPRRLAGLERALYRFSYRQFDYVAAMTETQRDRLVHEVGLQPARVTTIRHGPFSLHGIVPPSPGRHVIRVLVLGSIRRNKNVVETLRAVRRLQADGLAVELRLAGAPRNEEASYWEACQREIATLQNVDLIDRYIEDGEMPAVLSDIDAVICPYSDFQSQSGVAILAISNAVPIIATRSATADGDGLAAVLINPAADSEGIAAAIREFAELSPTERSARAKTSQQRFEQQNAWQLAIERIEDLVARDGQRR